MDSNSVPGSVQKSPCESQLDFISYWADKTVEEAVLHGVKLRQQKPQPLPDQEYDTIKIDFIKLPSGRKKPKKKYKGRKSRSNSPHRRGGSPTRSNKTAKDTKYNKCRKITCGMRIAELAVPTKRQCLDTWRNKSHTLPAYMIERLRLLVMDKQPVVQIADAFTCFNKKCKKKSKMKRLACNNANQCCKNGMMRFRTPELKKMSAIFGYKILMKLNTPMNITLSPNLTKIAHVVYHNIGLLVSKSKKIDMYDDVNSSIHKEITGKITTWISDVLEESNWKYLEDQIRDFEEEAGPVLDFLDDLVDGVLKICVPEPEVFADSKVSSAGEEQTGLEEESEKESLKGSDSHENTDQDDDNLDQGDENLDHGDENRDQGDENLDQGDDNLDQGDENIEEYEGNIDEQEGNIDEQEGNIDEHEENTDEHEGIYEEDEGNIDQDDKFVDTREGNIDIRATNIDKYDEDIDLDAEAESDEDLKTSEEAINTDRNVEEQESREDIERKINENEQKDSETEENVLQPEHDIKDILIQEAEVPPENVDDNIEIFNDAIEDSKELDDENDSIVKLIKENVEDDEQERTGKTEEVDVSWKASIEHISFASPNADLLSDADESWPEEFQAAALKPSQSVSKSITSLGYIKEDEERTSIIPNGTVSTAVQQIDNIIKPVDKKGDDHPGSSTKSQDSKETKNGQNLNKKPIKPDKQRGSKLEKPENLPGTNKDKNNFKGKKDKDKEKPKTKQLDTKLTKEDYQKMPKSKKTVKPKIIIETIPRVPKIKKNVGGKLKIQLQAEPSQGIIDLGSDLDGVSNTKAIKILSKTDKYRVDTKAAPSWVSRNYRNPICTIGKNKMKESRHDNDIRRWCRDLEQGYNNLITWNEWIENTSKTVCKLQQDLNKKTRDTGCLECPNRITKKEWMKLKRYIDSDASLWQNLNQNTRETIRTYRKMYQKRSQNVPTTIICDCPPPK